MCVCITWTNTPSPPVPLHQQEPEKDKRVVYFNFPSAITDKGATDLMEFGKSATLMHFGWWVYTTNYTFVYQL